MAYLYVGDALMVLKTLPEKSVQCCVTSPPYWSLRDYGMPGQLGLERTPEEYVARLVEVFREVRRVLKDDGTVWLNLGDSYGSSGGDTKTGFNERYFGKQFATDKQGDTAATWPTVKHPTKPKDLVGIPWRTAFALQADGWYLRSDIIWCLSGGTWLYVRTKVGGICLMMVKDLARLRADTVELWNGEHWTQMLGMSRSPRRGEELELTLRSGERLACTPTHRFPAERIRRDYRECGIFAASELRPGDSLARCELPEPDRPADSVIDEDAAWLAGLYIAEGSRSGETIQIAGHAKEEGRWQRLTRIAAKFGGSATRTVKGKSMNVRLYGRVLVAIIEELVTGRVARDKGFSPAFWRYSNKFVAAAVQGYLSGDGHWEAKNRRWRLGFTRNYNLERDLRTACARLGYTLILKMATTTYNGRDVPTFRGELRMTRSGHRNERNPNEIVSIKRARCRQVYDLGVADDPHVFALASGILTHNSKPNPMPESVRDRPTKSHEYIFLLSKRQRYMYDADAIAEETTDEEYRTVGKIRPTKDSMWADSDKGDNRGGLHAQIGGRLCRNARTVWEIATAPYPEAHFATFPPELAERCIKAGSRPGDTVLDPFGGSGTTAAVAVGHGRDAIHIDLNPSYLGMAQHRIGPLLCEVKAA